MKIEEINVSGGRTTAASRPPQSLNTAAGSAASPAPSASGRFYASRAVFAGPQEIAETIRELREALAGEPPNGGFDERLLDLWTAVERCLLPAELDELRPRVFARLFGGDDDDARVELSRDERPILGGRERCR